MSKKPWDKFQPMARKCAYCQSQRPGMQPLTLFLADGTRQRGYWHLRCFALAKKAVVAIRANRKDDSAR